MLFIGIIPARYASTRFPGKPLVDLCGKSVIQRVYEQAKRVLDIVVVATDDERIFECVKSFGGDVLMTSSTHTCGTDRVYEAYEKYCLNNTSMKLLQDEDVVIINIQGDEPFIQPQQIEAIMCCFPTDIATLVHPFNESHTWDDLSNPNYVKVAIAHEYDDKHEAIIGRALYFSRSVIPFLRGIEQKEWLKNGTFYRHIGMYAYRADVLRRITQLVPSVLEQTESLEQLRWLENGLQIRVAETNHASIGIDTPEDLQHAIKYIRDNNNVIG